MLIPIERQVGKEGGSVTVIKSNKSVTISLVFLYSYFLCVISAGKADKYPIIENKPNIPKNFKTSV